MSDQPDAPTPESLIADAQRRALFAAEVIVNRRLHDFSSRYQCQYSNDVAIERKAIEKEIAKIRRRVPAAPGVDDGLVAAVAGACGVAGDDVRRVLIALAAMRPDVLRDGPVVDDDEDEDDDY